MRAPTSLLALLPLLLLTTVSCSAAAPVAEVALPPPSAPAAAAAPARPDAALPEDAALVIAIDVGRLDSKIGGALERVGEVGRLLVTQALHLPPALTARDGIHGALALDATRPVTLAVQGPTAEERQIASDAAPPRLATRVRVLLPSTQVALTRQSVRAALLALHYSEAPSAAGGDVRLKAPGDRLVVELTAGSSVLIVDAVAARPEGADLSAAAADAALQVLRSASLARQAPAPLAGRTLHVEYDPAALAILSIAAPARALVGDTTGPYFGRVTLDDDPSPAGEAVVLSARLGGPPRRWAARPAPSIRVPLPGDSQTLDVDRVFLQELRVASSTPEGLGHLMDQAGDFGAALGLPSLLPLLARDQFESAPRVLVEAGFRFERFGATSNDDLPHAVFYGLLPAGTARDLAVCALATVIQESPRRTPVCRPAERLRLGAVTKHGWTPRVDDAKSLPQVPKPPPPAPIVAFARLVQVGDRYVVLVADDRSYLERAPAPVPSEAPRPAAYAETTWATLAQLCGLTLPVAIPGKITVSAADEGDRLVFRVGAPTVAGLRLAR